MCIYRLSRCARLLTSLFCLVCGLLVLAVRIQSNWRPCRNCHVRGCAFALLYVIVCVAGIGWSAVCAGDHVAPWASLCMSTCKSMTPKCPLSSCDYFPKTPAPYFVVTFVVVIVWHACAAAALCCCCLVLQNNAPCTCVCGCTWVRLCGV